MKPESIVVSLEYAKRLKEAGWPQEPSCFWWFEHWQMGIDENGEQIIDPELIETVLLDHHAGSLGNHSWAAPTAEEILRRLPKQTADDDFLTISPEENGWAVYYETSKTLPSHTCKADTLANAAAQMACYLVEQGLLSFKND